MKNRYEALLVLNLKGSEEGIRELVERIEGVFKAEGAAVEQVQRMDKRQFSYVAGALDAGYFVNFVFEGEPAVLARLRAKFSLDPDVYRQHYQRLRPKKAAAEAKPVGPKRAAAAAE